MTRARGLTSRCCDRHARFRSFSTSENCSAVFANHADALANTWEHDSQTLDLIQKSIRNRKVGLDVNNLNERLGVTMLTSPVAIYLGCAGLIVGSLGLGAQYMLGGNSVSATNNNAVSATNDATPKQPLFARSVEEASLPSSHWASHHPDVAHYESMVKPLTTPSAPPAPAAATPQANAPQATAPQASAPQTNSPAVSHDVPAPKAAERTQPREAVRDIPQQTQPPKRTRNARTRDDATASTEQADPRDAYAKADREARSRERQRNATQVDSERRDPGSRRSERRYGNRDDAEFADTRSRSDRRRVEVEDDRPRRGERRVIVQEEPEPRIVRGPEQRDGGFSPFRLFGIFER
jgi:hypothetical protein